MLLISELYWNNESDQTLKIPAVTEINSMYKGKTVLSQMQSIIFGYDFRKTVNEYNGDKGIRSLTTANLMSIMLYVHMARKQSLRDIVDSLMSKRNLWYHLGLTSISRNNLSYALQNRSSEIFEKTFYMLLGKLQKERGTATDKRFKFKMPVKSIDSTTISLCLSLFDWAKFRITKGGIKLHVVYDNKEQLPEFINISAAGSHDITKAKTFPIKAESIYAMDKGYICFKFFQKVAQNKAFFVTRTKSNTRYRILKRNTQKQKNIKADWTVKLTGVKADEYSGNLRVVKYKDLETGKTYEFLTNNFRLSAQSIADVYKARWDIELFFKWIKQNLKIKTFIGTSENAVRIQIWTALIACLLTEYLRFKVRSSYTLLKTFRLMCENLLFSIDIHELLNDSPPKIKNIFETQEYQLTIWA